MDAYIADPDLTLHVGGALDVLASLDDESIDACVTSPPFFGLRDYGTGTWDGGDPGCDHERPAAGGPRSASGEFRATGDEQRRGGQYRDACPKCGAVRVDDQIGLEATPDDWAAALVAVFDQVRRVLRPSGVLIVECGDSYGANHGGNTEAAYKVPAQWSGRGGTTPIAHPAKAKDLIGQPFLLAFALRDAGWWWRGVYPWAKPNPMPESATDRCTTAHSYVLHFAKQPRYYWDGVAIAEPVAGTAHARGRGTSPKSEREARLEGRHTGFGESTASIDLATRNARSVWTIPTEPSGMGLCPACHAFWPRNAPDQHCGGDVVRHYAAFPIDLADKAIKATTSERGVCPCGAPWVRVVEKGAPELAANTWSPLGAADQHETLGPASTLKHIRVTETVGWEPTCECGLDPVPAVVLDPFAGSGTTLLAARRLGRHSVGVELNPYYAEMILHRSSQQSLLAEGAA